MSRVDAGSESLTAGWDRRRRRRRKRRAEYEEGALRVKGRFENEVSLHHDTTIREWTFGTDSEVTLRGVVLTVRQTLHVFNLLRVFNRSYLDY